MKYGFRHCGGETKKCTVDDRKNLDPEKKNVAGSETGSGFKAPVVWHSDFRANLPTDYRAKISNDKNSENTLDFNIRTCKAEETSRCSSLPTSSAGSPLRWLPREFSATYSQTSPLSMGNQRRMNSINSNHQDAGQVASHATQS